MKFLLDMEFSVSRAINMCLFVGVFSFVGTSRSKKIIFEKYTAICVCIYNKLYGCFHGNDCAKFL
jgi:hypothetical protein